MPDVWPGWLDVRVGWLKAWLGWLDVRVGWPKAWLGWRDVRGGWLKAWPGWLDVRVGWPKAWLGWRDVRVGWLKAWLGWPDVRGGWPKAWPGWRDVRGGWLKAWPGWLDVRGGWLKAWPGWLDVRGGWLKAWPGRLDVRGGWLKAWPGWRDFRVGWLKAWLGWLDVRGGWLKAWPGGPLRQRERGDAEVVLLRVPRREGRLARGAAVAYDPLLERAKMTRASRNRGPRRAAWTLAALAAATACDDLSPRVGPLESPCGDAGSASESYGAGYDSGTATYYGSAPTALATSSPCASGGEGGANMVVAGAGVSGNVVIADQLNNRVIVVNRQGSVLWTFGDGKSVAGPTSVVAPNDAEYLPTDEVLIAGTGVPSGGEPTCGGSAGCVDDRVIIVDYTTRKIVWQFGGHSGSGFGVGALSAPASAALVGTAGGAHVLISDQANGRVVEVDRASGSIVWRYPSAGDAGGWTISPQSAERLANGNTLIADQGGSRVLEVTPAGAIAWQYPEVVNPAALDWPAFASRLANGHTLIADSDNDRVLEIDATHPGNIVWSYRTDSEEETGDPAPTGAVRLANGHTLITELGDDKVIEVDDSSPPKVVYVHGASGQAGWGKNELNQPYNAKVVGDYTGLSAPGSP